MPFFVVSSGELQVLRPSGGTEALFVTLGARQFTGEGTMLTGRRGLTRIGPSPGEVIQARSGTVLGLARRSRLSYSHAAFIPRIEMIAALCDVGMIGSTHCAGTLGVKEFLTRNGHPFHYIDLDRDADAQDLLDRFHVTAADVPVVICRGDSVLRNPSNQQIADCLGFNDAIDRTHVRDLVIVGAGPAGLAAACTALEGGMCSSRSNLPGGQGARAPNINYMVPAVLSVLDLRAARTRRPRIRRAGWYRGRSETPLRHPLYSVQLEDAVASTRGP